ncbi:DUF4097 family beta strand repeat-containing protein [Lactovum miscens]|uniref:DUF4097 and DUF4098 domain-containing protein YvlB n=1 Tax=Lactovum miscens TaxID=190387 RepID=A0A841C6Z3_9LACT|nr:DUF4097 domain-containing protein [Lactovum miscens]MBB5887508.1 DUF4097 and DUF4098 domain-containing protein YvlB [Lactovum miscens]
MADKKERILDLMRKGIITNDEAIELLEKADISSEDIKSEENKNFDKEGFESHKQDTGESIKNTFNQAADKIVEAFKGLSKTVDDNVDFSNGWPKVKTQDKTVEFDIAESFHSVRLDVKAGKVVISSGDNAHIKVDYKVFGPTSDFEAYISENTKVEVLDEVLNIFANGRVAADVNLYLPRKEYEELKFVLLNGKVDIDNLTAKDIVVSSKNGELLLNNTTSEKLSLDLINGDIKFDGSFVEASAGLTNGSVRITQRDRRAKSLNVKNINGDIKLSVPETLALTGRVKTVFGGYKTRLRLDQPFESGKNGATVVRSGSDNLTFDMEIKSGTIWLKDGE